MAFAQFNAALLMMFGIAAMIAPPLMGAALDASGHVYRLTFFVSAGLSSIGLGCLIYVYRRFMALGGPKHYVAPMPPG